MKPIAAISLLLLVASTCAAEPTFTRHEKTERVHLNASADDATMQEIPSSTKILFMIQGTQVTPDGMQRLKDLPELEFLRINHCKHGDAALTALTDHPKLRVLMMWRDSGVTAVGVKQLATIDTLTRVDFTSMSLSHECLENMPPQINSLTLHSCNIGDTGLAALPTFAKLKGVSFQFDEGMTDAGLIAFLARHPHCESVSTDVLSDRLLDSLAKLPQLKSIWLSGSPITTSQIQKIGCLQSLERVTVSAKLNDEQLACIRRLPNTGFKYVANRGKYVYLD